MRERALTLLLALGALALFYAMFVRSPAELGPERNIARPLTTERRGNGYFAAREWLERAGVRTESLRGRYGALGAGHARPATGNLLVVTLPAVTGFRTDELVALDRWIRAGNTLLVMAALDDEPDWAAGGVSRADLKVLTGLDFERQVEAAPTGGSARQRAAPLMKALAEPQAAALVPDHPFSLLRGVRRATAFSDYPPAVWAVHVPYDGFPFALAHVDATRNEVLWERAFGQGGIVVSGFGSLLTNRAIGQADNAALLANLVAQAVAPRGAVLFDDFRQGLASNYDPARFFHDRRLYVTIGILAALWFAWVLGSTRLRVPARRRTAPREADLLRAAGGFLARVLRPEVAARRLLELLAVRLAARLRLPPGSGMPWEWLERQPRLAAADLAELRRCYARTQAGRRVPLVRLRNLIVTVDRQVS